LQPEILSVPVKVQRVTIHRTQLADKTLNNLIFRNVTQTCIESVSYKPAFRVCFLVILFSESYSFCRFFLN